MAEDDQRTAGEWWRTIRGQQGSGGGRSEDSRGVAEDDQRTAGEWWRMIRGQQGSGGG